jgi:glycosyltransferase involved in cell wall biosynthesis
VDMHSADDTQAIARSMGARVELHEPVGYVEPARAFSVERARGDWIMILDSDEAVPRKLSERLREIAASGHADIVEIPELNYFFGAPVLGGGWHPDVQRHLRFFKRGTLSFSHAVHSTPQPMPGAKVLQLRYEPGLAIEHFAYLSIGDFVERTNRYTELETDASESIDAPGRWAMAREVAAEGWTRYVRQRGYKDGPRGWALAVLMMTYRALASLKTMERAMSIDPERVAQSYRERAATLIAEYEDKLR